MPTTAASSDHFLFGVLYPLAYWIISGLAALHSEVRSLFRGPSERRVVWNIPRQPLAEQRETPHE